MPSKSYDEVRLNIFDASHFPYGCDIYTYTCMTSIDNFKATK